MAAGFLSNNIDGSSSSINRLSDTPSLNNLRFGFLNNNSHGQPTPLNQTKNRVKKKVKVIDAVVDATEERVNRIGQKIKDRDHAVAIEELEIEMRQKRINTIKSQKLRLESKYKELKKTKKELKAYYQSIIDKLTKEALIEKFETDDYQRVIITTKPIMVKAPGWLVAKNAGIYQIRIDFNGDHYGNSINILNTTQHFSNYDSPTISGSAPCWGNIAGDIDREFDTQDLYELVIDLIDYIRSPDTTAGFLSYKGNKAGGWDQFFEAAEKRSKNYSFNYLDSLLEEMNITSTLINDSLSVNNNTSLTVSAYHILRDAAGSQINQQRAALLQTAQSEVLRMTPPMREMYNPIPTPNDVPSSPLPSTEESSHTMQDITLETILYRSFLPVFIDRDNIMTTVRQILARINYGDTILEMFMQKVNAYDIYLNISTLNNTEIPSFNNPQINTFQIFINSNYINSETLSRLVDTRPLLINF